MVKVHKKIFKKVFYISFILFLIVNIVAFNHAFHFSNYSLNTKNKTKKPEDLSVLAKFKVLFMGISNPKPQNKEFPVGQYDIVHIKTHHNYTLNAWQKNKAEAKGTIILFHGYTGKKSDLLNEAQKFYDIGYNTFMVDFFGSGDSDGNKTTFGYLEAEDVINAYKYINNLSNNSIVLFGASMGAVAILKAVSTGEIKPDGIILECPYGKLLTTIKNRFDVMGFPSFGFAELLVFWGGVQNGYWGFSMNAIKFARKIDIPVLIFHGGQDKRASLKDVQALYENLQGRKNLKIFDHAEHEAFINKYEKEWTYEVINFLND